MKTYEDGLNEAAELCNDLAASYDKMSKQPMLTKAGKSVHDGMWAGAKNCASRIQSLIKREDDASKGG